MAKNEIVVGEQVDLFQMLPEKFTKSNYLIKSKYKMTATEHKVYNLSLIKVRYNQNENRPIAVIYANEILEITGRNTNNWVYKEMKDIADRLSGSKKILLEDEINKKYKAMVLIGSVEYIDGEGKLIVKFEQDAKDLVLNLSNEISELYTIPYKKIKNYHSLMLYEMLQSRMFKEKRNGNYSFEEFYTVDELKYNLSMIELTKSCESDLKKGKISLEDAIRKSAEQSTEFKKYQSFKRTFDKTIKDVNEYTNLDVICKTVRKGTGGKLAGFKLLVKEKEKLIDDEKQEETIIDVINNETNEISDEKLFELIDELREMITEKIKMSEYKTLLQTANYDLDIIKEKYSIAKSSTSEIKNLVGWLVKAIKTDYKSPVAMDKEVKEEKSNVKKESQPKGQPKGLHFEGERQRTREEYDAIEKRCLAK